MTSSFSRPRNSKGKYIQVISESSVVNMWGRGEIDNENYLLAMDVLSERIYKKLTASPRPSLCLETYDEFTYKQTREIKIKSA